MRAIIMLCLGLWAALLLNPGEVYAQRGLPGQVALGVNGGIADGFSFRDSHGAYRFWGELELTRYNRNHSYWNFAVSCLRKDYRYEGVLGDQLVPMAQFTAEAGYNHPLISDRGRNISLFAGLAGVAGYETTNWGDNISGTERRCAAMIVLYTAGGFRHLLKAIFQTGLLCC